MSSLTALIPFEWFEIHSTSRPPQLRVGHSGTFDSSSSNIYLIGGANPSECFADIHSLSLPSNTSDTFIWTKLIGEDSAVRRYEHSAILSSENNDQIVFFGGANTENNYNDIHVFHISTKTIENWTPKENKLVSPRTHHASCCIQNGLYIFSGGFQGVKAVDDAELYRFDLTSRTWSCVPAHGSPPEQRHGHCLLSLGNSCLYLHGGMDGRTFFSTLYSIDINEKPPRWKEYPSSSSSSQPMARAAHGGVAIESTSTLFIFGGLSRNGQALNDTWSWSANNQQWTEILCRSLPRPRLDFAYCLVESQDKEQDSKKVTSYLFIHGGTDTQGEVFDDCFLLRAPPPSKKSVFGKNFEIEINAWEDSPSSAPPETLWFFIEHPFFDKVFNPFLSPTVEKTRFFLEKIAFFSEGAFDDASPAAFDQSSI